MGPGPRYLGFVGNGSLGLRLGTHAPSQGGQPPPSGGCCRGALDPGHRRHEDQDVDEVRHVEPGRHDASVCGLGSIASPPMRCQPTSVGPQNLAGEDPR